MLGYDITSSKHLKWSLNHIILLSPPEHGILRKWNTYLGGCRIQSTAQIYLVLQHGKLRPLVSVSSPYLKESSEKSLEVLQNLVQSPYWILSWSIVRFLRSLILWQDMEKNASSCFPNTLQVTVVTESKQHWPLPQWESHWFKIPNPKTTSM